jgi:hypothetical protein
MNDHGVRFCLVKEGERIGNQEWLSDNLVNVIIAYNPQLSSLRIMSRVPDSVAIRDMISPQDFETRPTLSQLWRITFVYHGNVTQSELPIEYTPEIAYDDVC